ncbi:MAG: hypothetical protein ACE37B_00295 [Ilumatobacter sp.]|uniref:hypothetical protein n=1 Tax=Ilumatobacter sp. TaxID=1967498 RepID=UPI00391ACCA4
MTAAPATRPPATSAQTNPLFVFDATTATEPKRRPARRGRVLRTVIVVSMLGGLGYAGAVHGPELYDQYVTDQSPEEPAAPLAFPVTRGEPAPIRTATFVVDGLYTDPDASYTVTVDFETLVSQVTIDRHDEPDLEIMTFLDDAVVRRTDSAIWYQIQRGAFPLDDQLELSDWIRRADDVIPREVRTRVSIDEATVADINGVSTRHLVLTLDPAILDERNSPMPTLGPLDGITLDEGGTDPATGAVAGTPAGTPAAGTATEPGAGPTASGTTIEVEVWIDRDGLIRRSHGLPMLGAETITVLETSGDAWIPEYPASEQIGPMTAAALIELGL